MNNNLTTINAMKSIVTILSALVLLIGCTNESGIDPIPTVGSTVIELTSQGDQLIYADENSSSESTIEFESTSSWSASIEYEQLKSTSTQEWLSLSKTSGSAGTNQIEVSAEENFSGSDRSAYVIIGSDAGSISVYVTQLAVTQSGEQHTTPIYIESKSVSLSSSDKAFTVVVVAEVECEVQGSSWITYLGHDGENYNFTVEENSSVDIKEGTITFSYDEYEPVEVTVTQSGIVAEELELSTYYVELEHSAEDATITIISGSGIACSENISWLSVGEITETTISLEVDNSDPYYSYRTGTITVTSDGGYSVDVEVKQIGMLFSVDYIDIPDVNFKAFLVSKYDLDGNEEIDEDEAARASYKMDCSGLNIQSLEGLEYFTGVTMLYFGNNNVSYFNASLNPGLTVLSCDNNPLTSLDLTYNTALYILSAKNCENLTSIIGLAGSKTIEVVYLDGSGITSVDLTGCTSLSTLSISGCESLSNLGLSGTTNLQDLTLQNLSSLSEFSASNASSLYSMTVTGCSNLGKLDVSNCTSLLMLTVTDNGIYDIDLSGCTKLMNLNIKGNTLSSISTDGLTSLSQLNISDNSFSSISLVGCPSLTILDVSYNNLSSLSLTNCQSLESLDVSYNNITSFSSVGVTSDMVNISLVDINGNNINEEIPSWYEGATLLHEYRRYEYEYWVSSLTNLYTVYYTENSRGVWYPGEPTSGIHDWSNPNASKIDKVVPISQK